MNSFVFVTNICHQIQGWISKSTNEVHILKSVKDVDENKSKTYLESYCFDSVQNTFQLINQFPTELNKPTLLSISPSKSKSITIRTTEKRQLIELKDETSLRRFDVSKCLRSIIS